MSNFDTKYGDKFVNMNRLSDDNFGIWIHNLPYNLVEGRKYVEPDKDVDIKKYTKCSELIFNFSGSLEASTSMNGRNFYNIYDYKYQIPRELYVKPIKKGMLGVTMTNDKRWYHISNLVCSIFNVDNVGKFFTEGTKCTEFGKKISKSLIKIASTRIFSSPEQSILELPVNSIDAYNVGTSVGKFGMGFFSILYWLVDHPDRELMITSYYKEGGNNYNFICRIVEYEGELQFNLNFSKSNVYDTGVNITLYTGDDNFTNNEVKEFGDQLNKLKFVKSVTLAVESHLTPLSVFNDVKNNKKIIVSYSETGIIVEDYAKGISLEVLLTKLFVPAVSTKTIAMSMRKSIWENMSDIQYIYLENDDNNTFTILVRNIAVVQIEFDTDIEDKYDIILDLPSNTRIPVSRDDIILVGNTFEKIRESVKILYDKGVSMGNIYIIQKALKSYINYTTNEENNIFFSEVLVGLEKMSNILLLPYNYIDVYKVLGLKGVASEVYDVYKLEKILLEYKYDDGIFFNKKVIYGDFTENVSNGGVLSYLFVQNSYVKKYGKYWVLNISISYINDKLYPIGKEFQKIPEKYKVIKTHYDDVKLQYFVTILVLKLESLQNKYIYGYIGGEIGFKLEWIIPSIDFCLGISLNYTLKYIEKYLLFIDNLKPLTEYGGTIPWIRNYVSIYDNGKMTLYNYNMYKNAYYYYRSKVDKGKIIFNSETISRPVNDSEKQLITTVKEYRDNKKILNINIDKELKIAENLNKLTLNMALVNYKVLDIYYYNFPVNTPKILSKFLDYIKKWADYCVQPTKNNRDLFLPNPKVYSPYVYFYPGLKHNYYKKLFLDSTNVLQFQIGCELIRFIYMTKKFKLYRKVFGNVSRKGLVESKGLLGVLIKYILLKIDKYTTKNYSMYVKWDTSRTYVIVGSFVQEILLQKLAIDIEIYVDQILNISKIKLVTVPMMNIQNTFTENNLIQYVLRNNFSSVGKLFENITREKYINNLQITEIAINEGSTKTFINSVVTETIQNSLDAIRLTNPQDKNIYIDLSQIKGKKQLYYKITDKVGIKLEDIIYVMIPFLSNKTASEIITGEMGSGFFNLYRESDFVIIETVKDNQLVRIIDKPIYDDNHRVVDLTRRTYITESKEENYTSIYVAVNYDDDIQKNKIIMEFTYFVTKVFSLIKQANIVYNSVPTKINTEVFLTYKNFDIYTKTDTDFISYIFTKGIPFQPLYEFLSSSNIIPYNLILDIKNNIVLNIKHSAFTPVQTRARINMSPKHLEELKTTLFDTIYYYTLDLIEKDKIKDTNKYLENMNSRHALSSVLFRDNYVDLNDKKMTPNVFIPYYIPSDAKTSIAQLLIECYKIMRNRKYESVKDKIFDLLLKHIYKKQVVLKVIIKWLKNKNMIEVKANEKMVKKRLGGIKLIEKEITKLMKNKKYTKAELIILKEKLTQQLLANEKPTVKPINLKLDIILTKFVNIYWKLGNNLKIKGFSRTAPTIVSKFFSEFDTKIGYYKTFEHIIVIDTRNCTTLEINEFIDFFTNGTINNLYKINNNKLYNMLFSNKLPVGTVIHELEHARRNNSHTKYGSHNETVIKFPREESQVYTFEYGASKIYKNIIQLGLFTKLLNK